VQITDITNLFVNNGVAIAVIIYFMFRDYKFISELTKILQELKDSVNDATRTLKEKEEK
jgi:hypothetical protein